MEEPDYTTLPLRDLYDIRRHIDRERYAERFERLEQEIALREAETRAASAAVVERPLKAEPFRKPKASTTVIGCFVLSFGFVVIGFLVLFAGLSKHFSVKDVGHALSSSNAVCQSLSKAYPQEDISASVNLSTRHGRTVIVTLANSELAKQGDEKRENTARRIAELALRSDPERESSSGIKVIFSKHYIIPFVLDYEDTSDAFYFKRDELVGDLGGSETSQP